MGFDVTLGLTLVWLAWRALASDDLFKGIVLFIAFGLLMALAWVRLDAPDIALAEAAIGAGLTGALLLGALAKLEAGDESRSNLSESLPRLADKAKVSSGLLILLLLALVAVLAYAIVKMPSLATGLSAQVAENIAASGVSNPVTAALLNFRAYDTLLEMAVLLLAVLGIRSLAVMQEPREREPGAVLDMLSHLLVPAVDSGFRLPAVGWFVRSWRGFPGRGCVGRDRRFIAVDRLVARRLVRRLAITFFTDLWSGHVCCGDAGVAVVRCVFSGVSAVTCRFVNPADRSGSGAVDRCHPDGVVSWQSTTA